MPMLLFSPAWYASVKLKVHLVYVCMVEYSWVVDFQLSIITHMYNKVTWEDFHGGTLEPVRLLVVVFLYRLHLPVWAEERSLCFLLGAWKGWENNSNLILCYAWRVRTIRRSAWQRKHHDRIMAPIHIVSHTQVILSAVLFDVWSAVRFILGSSECTWCGIL